MEKLSQRYLQASEDNKSLTIESWLDREGIFVPDINVFKKSVLKLKAESDPVISTHNLGWVWETQNPFLFCVHHLDYFPEGNETQGVRKELLRGRNIGSDFTAKDGFRMYHGTNVPGFPAHPHRGFETVTVVLKGYCDHTDSLGGAGRYGFGDVQWMTAGSGLQHCEMFPLVKEDEENPLDLFQIWLNLPSKDKFVDPHYKMLWAEDIPIVDCVDDNGKVTNVTVIAGKIGDVVADEPAPNSWAHNDENEVSIFIINMEADAVWSLPLASEGVNRSMYLFEGSNATILQGGKQISQGKGIFLRPNVETTIQMGPEAGRLLILQGKPIDEPVVQHGPFVMNTRQEIIEAIRDYQTTQFGGWPFDSSDPVHPRDKKRFARYGDGPTEERD